MWQLSQDCTLRVWLSWDQTWAYGVSSVSFHLSALGISLYFLMLPLSLDLLKGEPQIVMEKACTFCFAISCCFSPPLERCFPGFGSCLFQLKIILVGRGMTLQQHHPHPCPMPWAWVLNGFTTIWTLFTSCFLGPVHLRSLQSPHSKLLSSGLKQQRFPKWHFFKCWVWDYTSGPVVSNTLTHPAHSCEWMSFSF